MRLMRILAAAALLDITSCGGSVDPATTRTELEQLVKAYHKAYDSADDAAVLALLDPDVTIPIPPSHFFRGKESCGAELKKGMDRIRDKGKIGKRTTYLGDIQVTVDGRIAIATYEAHVSEEGGTPSKSIFTRVFRHTDGKWLILAEHYK